MNAIDNHLVIRLSDKKHSPLTGVNKRKQSDR